MYFYDTSVTDFGIREIIFVLQKSIILGLEKLYTYIYSKGWKETFMIIVINEIKFLTSSM